MRIVTGLGNVGAPYVLTRHNAGFWLVDALATVAGASWQQKHGCQVAQVPGGLVVKPQGFMNEVGLPLARLINYFRVPLEDMVIAADEVYQAPGSVRIRRGGADGGHNGWKSVVTHLGPEHYLRLKIGVGVYHQDPAARAHQPELSDYVLQPLPHSERTQVDTLIDRLTEPLLGWLKGGEALSEETLHTRL